jgi:hypothetical protein
MPPPSDPCTRCTSPASACVGCTSWRFGAPSRSETCARCTIPASVQVAASGTRRRRARRARNRQAGRPDARRPAQDVHRAHTLRVSPVRGLGRPASSPASGRASAFGDVRASSPLLAPATGEVSPRRQTGCRRGARGPGAHPRSCARAPVAPGRPQPEARPGSRPQGGGPGTSRTGRQQGSTGRPGGPIRPPSRGAGPRRRDGLVPGVPARSRGAPGPPAVRGRRHGAGQGRRSGASATRETRPKDFGVTTRAPAMPGPSGVGRRWGEAGAGGICDWRSYGATCAQ